MRDRRANFCRHYIFVQQKKCDGFIFAIAIKLTRRLCGAANVKCSGYTTNVFVCMCVNIAYSLRQTNFGFNLNLILVHLALHIIKQTLFENESLEWANNEKCEKERERGETLNKKCKQAATRYKALTSSPTQAFHNKHHTEHIFMHENGKEK